MSDSRPPASKPSRVRLILIAAGFVLLWNTGFIGAEFGMPYSGPFTLLFWRYLLLTAVTAIIAVARGQLRPVAPRDLFRVALVGVLSHGAWLAFVLVPINRGVPAGIVSLVVALQPLLTGALSGIVTGERTSRRQSAGLVVGFAGVAIAVGGRLTGGTPAAPGYYLLPFLSAAAITIASLIQRRGEIDGSGIALPLGLQLLIQSAAAMLALFVPALVLESFATEWVPELAASILWLAIAVSLGAYALMWQLLSMASATRISSLFFVGPPVTMLFAWAAFGDAVIMTDLVGFLVAVGGIALVTVRGAT